MAIDENVTNADRIIQAKIELTNIMPFFSYILMNFRIKEDNKSVPTMGVDRYGNLFWNKKFLEEMSFNELCAVLCHEAGHIALETFKREGSRNHDIWNYATDLTINWIIQQCNGLQLPKSALLCDKDGIHTIKLPGGKEHKIKVSERNSEDIYDELEKIIKNFMGKIKGNFDFHFPKDPNLSDKENKENQEKWEKRILEAAVIQRNKGRGNLPGELSRYLGIMLNPQINWKKKLMAFLTKEFPSDFTMSRPGRRFYSTHVYSPHVVKESLLINVGIDCSGSVGQESYDKFITEIIAIARGFDQIKMYIQYWDVGVKSELEIINGNIQKIKDFKVAAGGGTCLATWNAYLKEKNRKSQIYVCLTDGFVEEVKREDLPTGKIIFVLPEHGSPDIVGNFGEVTKIN